MQGSIGESVEEEIEFYINLQRELGEPRKENERSAKVLVKNINALIRRREWMQTSQTLPHTMIDWIFPWPRKNQNALRE